MSLDNYNLYFMLGDEFIHTNNEFGKSKLKEKIERIKKIILKKILDYDDSSYKIFLIYFIEFNNIKIFYFLTIFEGKYYLDILILTDKKLEEILEIVYKKIYNDISNFNSKHKITGIYVPFNIYQLLNNQNIDNHNKNKEKICNLKSIDFDSIQKIKELAIKQDIKCNYIIIATTKELLESGKIYSNNGNDNHAEELLLESEKLLDEPIIIVKFTVPNSKFNPPSRVKKDTDECENTEKQNIKLEDLKIKCGIPCQNCVKKMVERGIKTVFFSINDENRIIEFNLNRETKTYVSKGHLMLNYDDYLYVET